MMDNLEGKPINIRPEELSKVLSVPPKKYEYLDHTADVHGVVPSDAKGVLFAVDFIHCLSRILIFKGDAGREFMLVRIIDGRSDCLIFLLPKTTQFSGGDDLKEAFEQAAVGMFGYMTEIQSVEIIMEEEVEAQGDDLVNLLYHFLDEWLFKFSAEPFFIARKIVITEFDMEKFRIKATGYGEEFNLAKHPQGTEVKAITYSNLQVHNEDKQHEVYVIVDI